MPYLIDSSAIITPFHAGSLGSLSAGMKHDSRKQTTNWLQEWFAIGFKQGHLVCAQEIVHEVLRQDDVASKLLRELVTEGLIHLVFPDRHTFEVLVEIEKFVREHFQPHQADVFLRENDSMLISLAKSHSLTIITAERFDIPQFHNNSGHIQGKVRIPFISWVFGVRCISLYHAFQDLALDHSTTRQVG